MDPDGPEGRTRHTWGLPEEGGTLMPRARVLIATGDDTSFMLYRIAADGEFGGDTWHETLDDVKHQVEWEYQDAVSDWHEIPGAVSDHDWHEFAARLAKGEIEASD